MDKSIGFRLGLPQSEHAMGNYREVGFDNSTLFITTHQTHHSASSATARSILFMATALPSLAAFEPSNAVAAKQ